MVGLRPMTRFDRWEDLPFAEIWLVDTEFYPGRGLANGGRGRRLAVTLSAFALTKWDMKRWVGLWQDELGPFPPYRLDGDALFVAYANAAEYGHTWRWVGVNQQMLWIV